MTMVHRMHPASRCSRTGEQLMELLQQFARSLGFRPSVRDDDVAYFDDDDDALGSPEDRELVRRCLALVADQDITLLDSEGHAMFDGLPVTSAALKSPSRRRAMIDEAVLELGDKLGKPTPPRASVATFAHSQETPVNLPARTAESDEEYAIRINAEASGLERLTPSPRAALDAPSTGSATFALPADAGYATDEDADEAYARRANAEVLGKERLGNGGTAAPAADARSTPFTYVQTIPAPPTPAEIAAFMARAAAKLGGVLLTQIRKEIAALERQASAAPNGMLFIWTHEVHRLAGRIAPLKAMLVAVESGKPYKAPTPAEIAEARGKLIATVALSYPKKYTLSSLVNAMDGRLQYLRTAAASAESGVDSLLVEFVRRPDDGIESLMARFHKASREASPLAAELEAIERTRPGIRPALASAVARAVESAGGRESLEDDLADLLLIQGTPATPDPDEEELAAVTGQLKALGASAAGRAAQGLQARRDELSKALEARRDAAREVAATKAYDLVEAALAGSLSTYESVTATVLARPDAFDPGLPQALSGVPRATLDEAGYAGFQLIML